jgi:hypothetical protein
LGSEIPIDTRHSADSGQGSLFTGVIVVVKRHFLRINYRVVQKLQISAKDSRLVLRISALWDDCFSDGGWWWWWWLGSVGGIGHGVEGTEKKRCRVRKL